MGNAELMFSTVDFDSLLAVEPMPVPSEGSAYFFLPGSSGRPDWCVAALAPPEQVQLMCAVPVSTLLLGFLRDDNTRRCFERIHDAGRQATLAQPEFPLCVVIGGMYWIAMRIDAGLLPLDLLRSMSAEFGLTLRDGPPRLLPQPGGGEHTLQVDCGSYVLWREGLLNAT